MPLEITTQEEAKNMAKRITLKQDTGLSADGKAVPIDSPKATTLLARAGKEIDVEQAREIGIGAEGKIGGKKIPATKERQPARNKSA